MCTLEGATLREREYASRCSPRLEDSSSERLPEPRTSSQPLPTQPACYEARRPVQHRCSLAPMRVDTRSLSTVSCVLLFALLSHSLPRVCLGRCLSCLRLNCCIEKNAWNSLAAYPLWSTTLPRRRHQTTTPASALACSSTSRSSSERLGQRWRAR